jgi:hypothetical protein
VCTDHAEAIEGDEGVFEHDGAQGRQVYVSTWAFGSPCFVFCLSPGSRSSVGGRCCVFCLLSPPCPLTSGTTRGPLPIGWTILSPVLVLALSKVGRQFSHVSAVSVGVGVGVLLIACGCAAVKIKKNANGSTKFKLRTSRYLYTFIVDDAAKAEKMKSSFHPGTHTPWLTDYRPSSSRMGPCAFGCFPPPHSVGGPSAPLSVWSLVYVVCVSHVSLRYCVCLWRLWRVDGVLDMVWV